MTLLRDARRWLHRKQLRFEVTFGIYMHTAWEKFALYSIIFLLFGLAFIAAILYLPHHVVRLAGRAWYYIKGDDLSVAPSARGAAHVLSSAERLVGRLLSRDAVAAVMEKEL